MATDLSSLIRVNRHALEQKQKTLAELYRQAEELEEQKAGMLAKLEDERRNLTEQPDGSAKGAAHVEMLTDFERYKQGVMSRVAELDEQLDALGELIDEAREDMREAFAEVKKLEITQENREEEEAREIDKKQSDELDEIGLEIFRQKQDDHS